MSELQLTDEQDKVLRYIAEKGTSGVGIYQLKKDMRGIPSNKVESIAFSFKEEGCLSSKMTDQKDHKDSRVCSYWFFIQPNGESILHTIDTCKKEKAAQEQQKEKDTKENRRHSICLALTSGLWGAFLGAYGKDIIGWLFGGK